jgi:hypothetical protein
MNIWAEEFNCGHCGEKLRISADAWWNMSTEEKFDIRFKCPFCGTIRMYDK